MAFLKRQVRPELSVVVVAAGRASRMEGIDKQRALLDGVPVVVRTLLAFEECPCVGEIILVVREEQLAEYLALTGNYPLKKLRSIVRGGESRQASVFAGVRASDPSFELIAVHDGARPLVSRTVIESCAADAKEHGAAAAAVPVKDTIKVMGGDGCIDSTPDRSVLYGVQTPQIFRRSLYERAMEQAERDGREYTDDCQLAEALGQRVFLSRGDYRNLKITTPEDLLLAEALVHGAKRQEELH